MKWMLKIDVVFDLPYRNKKTLLRYFQNEGSARVIEQINDIEVSEEAVENALKLTGK